MKKVFLLNSYIPVISKIFTAKGYQVLEGNFPEEAAKADAIFSINYEPDVAEYCWRNQKKYVSWIVDCPHTVLYSRTFYYKSNYIFLFDYNQYCLMKARRGESHVYYQPLASDIESFERTIRSATYDKEEYSADVSFVGRLYRDKDHALLDTVQYLPPYVEGYLEALMGMQKQIWGADFLKDTISNEVWDQLRKYIKWNLQSEYDDNYEETVIGMIQQKIAQKERMEMCSLLAKEFDFALYTKDETEFDKRIDNRGYVDYVKEMPLVFSNSKINMNITLRSISTGIPLRCLDIMACGGFLMTNYQAELEEYFVDGQDLVIYTDFSDMKEKIAYYLSHEDERKYIAENGKKKIAEKFTYQVQLGNIIDIMENVE